MGRIEGTSRDQTMVLSYEDFIGEEDIVRVIDRFVEVCEYGGADWTVEAARLDTTRRAG